jgi:hypothetical protein
MSLLNPTVDPTGQMSQVDMNTQDINNLIDTVNELQSSTGNIINQPTYIELNDGSTNRVIFGYNSVTQTWGIFAVPAGSDISEATVPQDFSLNSDAQYPIIFLKDAETFGSISVPTGTTGQVSVTIPHNLGYIPAFDAFAQVETQDFNRGTPSNFPTSFYVRMITNVAAGELLMQDVNELGYYSYLGVDTINLYIGFLIANDTGTNYNSVSIPYAYRIYYDSAG